MSDTSLAYLVEIDAAHGTTGVLRTFTFSSHGFTTLPTDTPANTHYAEAVRNPGNYERSIFSTGTTSGDVSVGAGLIELINLDGALDELRDYAFDGYPVRILTVDRLNPAYQEAKALFSGTMEQVELSYERAKILIRDRLAELNQPIQTSLFLGTTIAGAMDEAEGQPDDLKGRPKPLCFGAPALIAPAVANGFDLIYNAGNDGLATVAEVRDKGVLLTPSGQDYPTITALRTAYIGGGQWATARNLGLIRLGSIPQGQVTCAPVKGAVAAERTAGQLARQILMRAGFVAGTHFLEADIAALDAANPAEIGYYVDTDQEKTLDVLRKILGSVGASLVPDRAGRFRILRFTGPGLTPVATITKAELLEGGSGGRSPIQLLATGDQGRGVPAYKVSVKYRHNGAVTTANELASVNVTSDFRSFASEEWRTATAKNDAVKAIHKLSPELTFETYLLHEADAQAEANRQLALRSVRRDLFRVEVKGAALPGLEFNDTVALKMDRFGLETGKTFCLIGMVENYETGKLTLDLWG